jgi:predicted dehydrogenase
VQVSDLRVVQVGVGLWGRSWAELIAAAPGYELVGVAESNAAGRDWTAAELHVPAFPGLGPALAALTPDLVHLVSPPSTHAALAEEALAAGCHVLIEKPLAPSMGEGRSIADAAERAGRIAAVAQNYRFRRQSRALRQLVRGGALGRLLGIRISCRRDLRVAWITRNDWRGQMPHPYVTDMAIHHVDMLRMITGREFARVDARGWGAPDGPFRHDASVAGLLELDDGTPIGYEGTWAEARLETSWNGDWELIGSDGRATWTGGVQDALKGVVNVARDGGPFVRAQLPRLRAVDRAALLADLRAAIVSGAVPETSVADNLRSLATTLAIARSTEEGRGVDIAELLVP